MVTANKKSDGCWTCRLRRKKCDKLQPECRVCKILGINCHFNSRKPEWMDRGGKQREMAEKIKYQIKQSAAGRRERNQALLGSVMEGQRGFVISFESDILGSGSSSKDIESDGLSDHEILSPMDTGPPEQDTSKAYMHTLDMQSGHIHQKSLGFKHQTPSGNIRPQAILDILDHSMDDHIWSTLFPKDSDYEVDFIMKYFDYIFPFLFPFYRPAIFETGRGWLLSLLKNSRIAFHSALSLTSYFFTIALTDAYGDAYADCTGELWSRLEKQTDRCFEIIQTDMVDLNLREKTATVLEKVYAMESIVQILIFESVLGRSADWNLHLTPALALFEEVFNGADSQNSKMISVLLSIGLPSWYKVEYDSYIWNADQAGFRFFAALLIFIDVIGSTALQQSPKLSLYHSNLLTKQDDGAPILGFNNLRLSTVIGCQNSVIVAIGQIATLDAWKQGMKRTESLSMVDLVERAIPISTSLNSALDTFDSNVARALERAQDPLNLPFQSYAVRSTASAPSVTTTRIWTYAALIYLDVVVSGWQPSKAGVRAGVTRIVELLHIVPSNHLRTLAWPLCVAGCLASVDQEEDFRSIFAVKKKMELAGSLGEARQVMEKVWESRTKLDTEAWDLAACFSILTKPVLLF